MMASRQIFTGFYVNIVNWKVDIASYGYLTTLYYFVAQKIFRLQFKNIKQPSPGSAAL